MDRITDRRIIVVTRKTRLESLIIQYNTFEQAKFVIEHSESDFDYYVNEDKQYKKVILEAISILENIGLVQVLDIEYVSNFIFGKDDIIVVIGQDGLVANTLKYLDKQPLIGINPDVREYEGVLVPFSINDLSKIIMDLLREQRKFKEITLARADLNDGQSLLAVNDLFIGQKTHVSARYILEYKSQCERQSSSGIIVSTGLGSTGWFKSILEGASKIVNGCVNNTSISVKKDDKFTWNSEFLYYTVREPYPSKTTQSNMVFGKISKGNSFKIKSLMSENGVIFSDGVENDFLNFNSGSEVTISIADKKGLLVI
ncbi:sugar kinase [Clostridium bornimense]|uniref:sugar kinase n=1 Tax=Clostridium bornimense TaxID=1216932 RepID=UPI001C128DC3|nr:sugar kinase [Clostridium bornimense]MBU5316367.1 sugar kinase [Clostridium bornimense]